MIHGPERIRVPSVSGDRIEIDCNWTSGVNGDYLKLRFNEQEAILPRSAFSRVAMILATEEEASAMIPTKSIRVRNLKKTVTLQLKKDMRAGEYLHVPVEFKVPLNDDQSIKIIQ